MKCLLLLLFAFLGDFALAAVPQATIHSSPSVGVVGVLQSRSQLVQILKNDLKESNLMQQLATDARHFDDYFQTYSRSVSPMVTELTSMVMSGGDNLFDATKPVYGWCATAKDLLSAFESLPDENTAEIVDAKNDILQTIFSENITSTVSNELKKLSNNLNIAANTLSSLSTQLDADFSEDSAFFESTLRNEFIKEKNKGYTPELINRIIEALKKLKTSPIELMNELTRAEGATRNAAIAMDNQPNLEPLEAFSRAYQAHNPSASPTPTQLPTTIDPQKYLPYKNRVAFRFGQTREFFKTFERHLNEMIHHINEVELKLSENNQREIHARETAAPTPQQNQTKRSAHRLMSLCANFSVTPPRN